MEFFNPLSLPVINQDPIIPACGACKLYKTCKSPKMQPTGKGKKKILIVAEAPGAEEDRQGRQLVGDSGIALMKVLRKFDIDMREDCWLTNALICRPPDNEIPDKKVIEYCRANLLNTIKELKPVNIILLGGTAVLSLIPWLWKKLKADEPISRWLGYNIPCQKLNAWISATYHPSFVIRSDDQRNPVPRIIFEKHLKKAATLLDRPYDKVPDYTKKVNIVYDTTEAASIIDQYRKWGGLLAFDYEANTLTPEKSGAKIVSCSICWEGKYTTAYPWHGAAIRATKRLLADPSTRKIASNLKYEERMTRKLLGIRVANWDHDTMLAAHAIDNSTKSRRITSIKFQCFVQLGVGDYSSHLEDMLADGKADEIPLDSLLLYNGMDSLLEYLVACKQKGQLK